MAEKASPQERLVLGALLLGTTIVGHWAVASYPLDVSGRKVPADPILAIALGVLAATVIAIAIALAVMYFGGKAGMRMIAREAWSGLLAGFAIGTLTGFFLRAVLYGPVLWLLLIALYAGAAYFIVWYSKR